MESRKLQFESFVYTRVYTQRYCLKVLLPCIIGDTYIVYIALIATIAGYTTDNRNGNWDKSLPYHMVKHHSDKLGLIKAQLASYCKLVLQTYAYMRIAKKDVLIPKLLRMIRL